MLPESGAALPVFAALVVDDSAVDATTARPASDLEIVVGDIVIWAGADAHELGAMNVLRLRGTGKMLTKR